VKRCAMFVGTTLFAVLTSTVAFGQSAPPPSPEARQVETLVNRAAALIEQKGKSAFTQLRVKDSEWFHGSTYLSLMTSRAMSS